MNGKSNKTNGKPRLFEINLLGRRAGLLRKRQATRTLGLVLALCIVIAGGIEAVIAAKRLISSVRVSLRNTKLTVDLAEQQRLYSEIDALRFRASLRSDMLKPLVPIVKRRTVWSPKLRAIAEVLPPASGVLSINASSGELIPEAAQKSKTKTRHDPPRLDVSILCCTSAGSVEDPISLLDRLRESEAFMDKMDYVRLESTEQSNWNGIPVVVLKSSAKGKVQP